MPFSAVAFLTRAKPHEEDENKSPGSRGSGGLKFFAVLKSSAPKVQPLKKQKGKKVAKEKRIVQVDLVDTPTLENKSKANVKAKYFPYPEFMDKELMTPAARERLEGDEEDLVAKF